MLTAEQFDWMYNMYREDDGYVYTLEFKQKVPGVGETGIGPSKIVAITKSKGDFKDFEDVDRDAELRAEFNNYEWTTHDDTYWAIYNMLTRAASKTKRTRKSFDATLEWLEKLPLDTRVEL